MVASSSLTPDQSGTLLPSVAEDGSVVKSYSPRVPRAERLPAAGGPIDGQQNLLSAVDSLAAAYDELQLLLQHMNGATPSQLAIYIADKHGYTVSYKLDHHSNYSQPYAWEIK